MTMPGNIKGIKKELADIDAHIARYRDDWINREIRGRCLRALGRDDEAVADLRGTLDRPIQADSGIEMLARGRVHQLVGDHDEATRCWQQATRAGEERGLDTYGAGAVTEAYFLLGHDDRAIDADERTKPSLSGRSAKVAELARARRDHLPDLADDVADYFRKKIRGTREPVGISNGFSLHDWYEIATELASELRGPHDAGRLHRRTR